MGLNENCQLNVMMDNESINKHMIQFNFVIMKKTFLGVIYGGRVKRNVVEFGDMVGVLTGRDPSDFYGYGHYCGIGGSGVVLDPIDA